MQGLPDRVCDKHPVLSLAVLTVYAVPTRTLDPCSVICLYASVSDKHRHVLLAGTNALWEAREYIGWTMEAGGRGAGQAALAASRSLAGMAPVDVAHSKASEACDGHGGAVL